MDLLRIEHNDFTLSVECANFWSVDAKSRQNMPQGQVSFYSWNADVQSAWLFPESGSPVEIISGENNLPLFYDNTDYAVWADFKDDVMDVQFRNERQDVCDRFSYKPTRHVLSGFLNYGNDIGKSDIAFAYKRDGESKTFVFSFEVLSTKLDYHKHWEMIVRDVEEEYRMLSLDYLRKTYHGISISHQNNENFDLVWWNVFQDIQARFIKSCRAILACPRHKLRPEKTFLRADKIIRFTPQLEQEFAENKSNEGHLYAVDVQTTSNNTFENRFFKHTLCYVARKYQSIAERVKSYFTLATNVKESIIHTEKELQQMVRNPFFRTVGKFEGMKQESLILQKDVNYSQIYRTGILLRKSFSLNEGLFRMQTKDIATLYEIWCFIQVSHIVKELLGESVEMSHCNRTELNNMFTYELGKGEYSRILFQKDDVELAELVYNPKTNNNVFEDDNSLSMENLTSRTVPQKPDIVLQLTKNDIEQQMKMTYLFDAKYRINGKSGGADTPPDDAINQMHRYRDAIYYQNGSGELKKEVIGGYILFPGDGERSAIEMSKYYTSINEVNIGAFPLRPGNDDSRQLLVNFIANLLEKKAKTIVTEVIPQKGTVVSVRDRVLVGIVKREEQAFEDGTATRYYSGKEFPTTISLDGLHYFAPYIKGKGVRDMYEITKIRTITSREAKGDDSEGNDLRLAFELGNRQQLFNEYHPYELKVQHSFTDTTIEELK